ncbi:MAG TPA: hypothetical protein VJ917_04120, partial [Saprospiraceae bacterium]|nr:hypothetical protein [Saprospiraceae bacterium]
MKQILRIVFIMGALWSTHDLFSQKHDYVYYTQGHPGPPATGIELKYQDSTGELLLTPKEYRGMLGWSPVFSDKHGEFLCYTNNIHLYDSLGRIAINGEEIAVGFYLNHRLDTRDYHRGFGGDQAAGIIPLSDSLFYLFHASMEFWIGAPDWAIDDISTYGVKQTGYSEGLFLTEFKPNEEGRIEVNRSRKKLELVLDTLVGTSLVFNKHANGEDWWIYAPEHYSKDAYLLHLDVSTGEVSTHGKTYYSELNDRVWTQRRSIPSPNGEYIATMTHIDVEEASTQIEIKQVDRCTGEMTLMQLDSFPLTRLLSGSAALEWSASGRFLYMARADYIFQFDIRESNPLSSADTIAFIESPIRYAGFIPDYPDEMWRLPNGEILVVSFNATPYLSYIRKPDEKGKACQFEYVTDTLPPDPLHPGTLITISTLPTYPLYRMPPLDYDCETSVDESERQSDVFV